MTEEEAYDVLIGIAEKMKRVTGDLLLEFVELVGEYYAREDQSH